MDIKKVDVSKCEFQKECIEYKDISVNHIINILEPCPCFKMSMAIQKENKCKYFTIYKQLQQLKQENEKLKEELKVTIEKNNRLYSLNEMEIKANNQHVEDYKKLEQENEILKKNRLCDANLVYQYEDLQEEKNNLEAKLEKIEEECKNAPMCDSEFSLRILKIIGE